jgi:hypothetical protein
MTVYHARPRRRPSFWIAAVVVALVAGGIAGALISTSAGRSAPASRTNAARAQKSGKHRPSTNGGLSVVAVSPSANEGDVTGTAAVTVTFSSPISTASPQPTLTPPTAGSWREAGDILTFTPSGAFVPSSVVTLTIPGGNSGVRAEDGAVLQGSVVEQFRIANGSVLRLQQLLSLLDYSPLSWAPTSAAIASSDASAQQAALFSPPAGSFTWTDHGWPGELRKLWKESSYNVFTKGLVISFQADHDLDPDGSIGPALWKSLLQALASNTVNTGGYNYALANKMAPETFTVWHDGRVVLRSEMNTGVAGSPTPDGNFPVFTRLRRQVMRGENPDGAKYADPVQFIAYFHDNDAVHYMDRADYGIPQSLGCIELPLASAAIAWPYLAYGTLVTVVH